MTLLMAWAPSSAWAKGARPKRDVAYRVLGISHGATPEQIQEAFNARIKARPSAKAQAQVSAAYAILSQPELRRQYDQGLPLEFTVAPGDRKALAELLSPIAPQARDHLLKTGHASVEQIANAASFYFATTAMMAHQCYKTRDSLPCRQYLESLQHPQGYVGFGVFVAAAHLTTTSMLKVVGEKPIAGLISGFSGMAIGAFASETFDDIAAMPEAKDYLDSFAIHDPAERKEKSDGALGAIWMKTFGDPTWYQDKAPRLASMLVAATASEITVAALRVGMRATAMGLRKLMQGKSRSLNCVSSRLDGWMEALEGEGLRGFPRFMNRRIKEIGSLLLFLGFDQLVRPTVNEQWEHWTLDQRLIEARIQLKSAIHEFIRERTPANESRLRQTFAESESLWNEYRRYRMASIEEVMSLHSTDLDDFDKEVAKPLAFYSWFADHGKFGDDAWTSIQAQYYTDQTTLVELEREMVRYGRGFFCGPDASQAFHDVSDHHGLPDLISRPLQVDPFRGVDRPVVQLCQASLHDLEKAFKASDYHDAINSADAAIKLATHPARNRRIDFYEQSIQQKIIEITGTKKISSANRLPLGIIASLDAEISDLDEYLARGTPDRVDRWQKTRRDSLEQLRTSATRVLEYYQTPLEKREPTGADVDDMLSSIAKSQDEEEQNAVRYLNSYILR